MTAYARRICLASSTSPTRLVSNVSRVDPGAGSLPPSPPSPDHPTSGSCRSRIVDATRALVERRSCHLRMMACMVRFEPQGSFSRCGCTPFRLKAGGVAQTHEERGRQGRSTIDRARRVQPRSPRSRRHLSTDGESDRRGATARDFNRDSIGSGRRATQRVTIIIPVCRNTGTTTGIFFESVTLTRFYFYPLSL